MVNQVHHFKLSDGIECKMVNLIWLSVLGFNDSSLIAVLMIFMLWSRKVNYYFVGILKKIGMVINETVNKYIFSR